MLEFLTRAGAQARQGVLHGLLAPNEGVDRGGTLAVPAPYVEFIDGPYQIVSDKLQIMNVLQQVLDARRPLSLTGRRSGRTSDTRLVTVDTTRDRILLRELLDDASHSQLLLDGRANITARHNHIPILFTLELSGSGSFDGIRCYTAPVPEWILFAQTRDSFRTCLPHALDARVRFDVKGIGCIEARVLDISESGIGALLPAGLANAVAPDDTFFDASLLTHDSTLTPLGLRLRYVGSAIGGPQRIGAALDLSAESRRQVLRRLILRHQPVHAKAN